MSTAAKVMLGKKVKVFSMGSYGGADGILLAGTEKIKISISITGSTTGSLTCPG